LEEVVREKTVILGFIQMYEENLIILYWDSGKSMEE